MQNFFKDKIGILTFCLVTLVIGLAGSFSERIQTLLIPRNEKGLEDFGKVLEVEDPVQQKLVNDVIWYPIGSGQQLFEGDSLQTGAGSSLIFTVSKLVQSRVVLAPDTFIRLKMFANRPLFVLEKGGLEISGTHADQVYVASGFKTQKIQLDEGVVNEVKLNQADSTVQIQKKQATSNVAEDATQKKTEATPTAAEVKPTPSSPDLDLNKVQRPMKYPYPENQTAFFQKKAGYIILFPSAVCNETCDLKVFQDNSQTLLTKTFKAQEVPAAMISYQSSTNSVYAWSFQDGGKTSNGSFYIKPSTPQAIQDHLKHDLPIVILDGL